MNEIPFIPYGRQSIDEGDIAAVADVLRSDWITTGPKIGEFERAVAEYCGVTEAVAVNSGTAALHAAMFAIGVGPGDEVVVPTMTFAATANCVLYCGAKPVFADVNPDTLTVDPASVEAAISPKTKAIVAMDYAGQPCDYDSLRAIADRNGLVLVDDGCHALGAEYKGKRVGSLGDLTCLSFHPVKHIATGEGGMILTGDPEYASRMRRFRNHGINADQRQRTLEGTWYYEMVDLGFNYRITDFQCALGLRQLVKLPAWLERRRAVAARYDEAFAPLENVQSLKVEEDALHAYHLYVVKIDFERLGRTRKDVFTEFRSQGIGVNVHYIPVHLHPYYRENLGTGIGDCPKAEAAYESVISLPMYGTLSDGDLDRVIQTVLKITS